MAVNAPRAAFPRLCGVVALVAAASCGPIVKPAAFRHRPDSVRRGSLLGPFEGRVVDADSKEPLSGAIVWCSWGFDRGVGHTAPQAARTFSVKTNADGRYRVPALRDLPSGLTTRLARFTMVIYKKGYVAYHSARRFNPRWPRRNFSQLNNTVRLRRWSPEQSHASHLLFIGGAGALREASAWERERAARELDEGRRRKRSVVGGALGAALGKDSGSKRRLGQAGRLLSTDDVRRVTKFAGAFSRGRLAAPGDAHDTLHLRATDRSERYDVAIRLWRLSGNKLVGRYDKLLAALPGAKQKDEVGDRSFFVAQGEILGLAFVDENVGALVLVTCGKGQCTDAAKLLELAKVVAGKVKKLPAASLLDSGRPSPKRAPRPLLPGGSR